MKRSDSPSWDALYAVAASQQGCFAREQAREAGFSDQLLYKHVSAGNIERIQRGIYRIARFPESGREHEELVAVWLWSRSQGVFSHETALQMHGLSDALPSKIHVTVPKDWEHRHIHPPPGVMLYFADLNPPERVYVGAVPVTTPARTLNDLAAAHGEPDIVESAARQALIRGLVAPNELVEAVDYLDETHRWFVRPEAIADLGGSWLLEGLSGTCKSDPPSDWRTDAEDFAVSCGARLRAARYYRGSRTMHIELVWPLSAREQRPTWAELRAAARARFGWIA